jgi:hypothetical protein
VSPEKHPEATLRVYDFVTKVSWKSIFERKRVEFREKAGLGTQINQNMINYLSLSSILQSLSQFDTRGSGVQNGLEILLVE